MKIKTSELTGAALIWAAARADGRTDVRVDPDDGELIGAETFDYLEWDTAGPIIEREEIAIRFSQENYWHFTTPTDTWLANYEGVGEWFGPTPLIAAMRAFVSSKLGDEVDVPEELK
jgi:hypothetical protein